MKSSNGPIEKGVQRDDDVHPSPATRRVASRPDPTGDGRDSLRLRRRPTTMSLAAIFVFVLVFALQLLDGYLDLAKKRGSQSEEQIKLRLEIKQLLTEANQLSTPSTFAQAAKLKRLAVAKEKELGKIQEQDTKGTQSLYDKYGKFMLVTKVLIYALLVLWFWSTPVTTVPQHLLQPFGKMFSLRGVDSATGHVVVGILPWLFLTSRVSKLLCQKFSFVLLRP
ncbi:hypothetical protein SEVIR_2G310100v4 [Setaria viridis]|uniref:Tail-anchored protein insertion receptor WRB n=2 Tax=Setaria viridis TaxID=4556 RepID=A0A4U6VZT7_SETVI|nr:hypothetical protein SEVIR_2G310100v2 [Setaria viridis]